MTRRRIVILSGSALSSNPRAYKEARTLAAAGFDVEVLGGWLDETLAAFDRELLRSAAFRYTPVIDFAASGARGRMERQICRAWSRTARFIFEAFGTESMRQLGYATGALLRQARARNADLYIGHTEQGLAAARSLLRSGRRVMIDMEDWYSEDLLPEARRTRPIALLRRCERDLLCEAAGATCPSHAMSRALAEAYGCAPPVLIYNAFPWAERSSLDGERRDRAAGAAPSVHWFSQTVGPGRGLEDLFAALPYLSRPIAVHLRGRPVRGFDDWLAASVSPPWRSHVFVHAAVPPAALLSRIAEHDIGFAGEMLYCRSRDLTVTNKILQYLLGGLAVVASDTAGQREIAAGAPEAVALYPPGDAKALAARIDDLLSSPERLRAARADALRAAKTLYCWECQQPSLLAVVERALARPIGAVGK